MLLTKKSIKSDKYNNSVKLVAMTNLVGVTFRRSSTHEHDKIALVYTTCMFADEKVYSVFNSYLYFVIVLSFTVLYL